MAWESRFSLTGKTALITGASSGIGAEIARVFAEAGADIAGHERNAARLAALGETVRAQGRRFAALTGELSDPGETEAVATQALSAFEKIDILVNSAGIALTGAVIDYELADWQRTMAVNLTAPFILSKALLAGMTARKQGKIINISSQTGGIALKDHAAYATSKGGLNALIKSLMTEAAPYNSMGRSG